MWEGYEFILASRSPRRSELLKALGIAFRVDADFGVSEDYPAGMDAEEIAPYLSRRKAEAYPHPLSDKQVLITADTVVIAGGNVLGKPAGRAGALAMLSLLSGRRHKVVTGVTVVYAGRSHTIRSVSDVIFRKIETWEAEYYVDNYPPYDKAGAYAIQEWIGAAAIERIEGSYYNIVGLPTDELYQLLKSCLKII